MGYSTGYFSEIGSFLKMAITQKIELGISSNFPHSISTSICIRKCNKNVGGDFQEMYMKVPGYYIMFFTETNGCVW